MVFVPQLSKTSFVDWYWSIGDRLYSSARNAFVSFDDADYAVWRELNRGRVAVPLADEDDLVGVLADNLPGVVIPTATGLKTYAAAQRWQLQNSGIVVGGVAVATDAESRAMIDGAYAFVNRNPSATVNWKAADGSFVAIDAATVIAIADAVGHFIEACFNTESSVVTGVDNNTITNKHEIDALFDLIAKSV